MDTKIAHACRLQLKRAAHGATLLWLGTSNEVVVMLESNMTMKKHRVLEAGSRCTVPQIWQCNQTQIPTLQGN